MSGQPAGCDVSSWQHQDNAPIDWEQARADGCTFVVVKATQGTTYVNPWLLRDLDDARAAGLLVGAYHYYATGVDPAEQATHFVSSLIGQVLDLGCWLDWEPPAIAPWQAKSEVEAFCARVEEVRPWCGLYVDRWWHEQLVNATLAPRALWLADPSTDASPPGTILRQTVTWRNGSAVDGADYDVLVSRRGLDIPTSPRPRPTGLPVHVDETPPEPPAHVAADPDDEDETTAS